MLHGGTGFPFFSSALYWYLATGSVGSAIQQLCFDCANPNYKDVVHKVVVVCSCVYPTSFYANVRGNNFELFPLSFTQ